MKRRQKRWGALFFALILCCAMYLPSAYGAMPTVTADGTPYRGAIVLRDNTSYIPIRTFFEGLGWSVEWRGDEHTAVVEKDGASFSVDLEAESATANGLTLPVTAVTQDGRIYLPLRLLGAMMEYNVMWDAERNAIELSSDAADDPFDEDDVYWLSHIICAEAGGEPDAGQVAVGNVVLNRVRSGLYPDTIYGVIFDVQGTIQFEPVANGTVFNDPTDKSVRTAKLALRGVSVVGDCMYFFNPSLSEGTWIVENCTYSTTIGCHRFYLHRQEM